MTKVCVAASAGGHLSQALRLADAYRRHPHFLVTTSEMARGQLGDDVRVYVVPEGNRSNPLKLLSVVRRTFSIIAAERPDVVLSTGAAPGCLCCLIGKLFGARVIWIDSLANVERLSLSGRIIAPVADLLLVQWEDLTQRYRRARYAGSVL